MDTKKNPVIDKLFKKYFDGESATEEKMQLYDLLLTTENESHFKEILLKELAEYPDDNSINGKVDFDFVYGNIIGGIEQNEIRGKERLKLTRKSRAARILIYCSGIAASFIIAFSLGNYILLSDKNASAPLIPVNFSEIKAPFGSKSEIYLPDGTMVILNAGSTLKYSSDFSLKNRDLVLTGEGYFKVAKNMNFPLVVSAGNISIKAIGTEFNVKAYDDEATIETTLVNGKVEITQSGLNKESNKYIDLNPNQKAIYIKEADSITIEKVHNSDSLVTERVKITNNEILISPETDVNQVVAWTQGKLIIKGERLDNLCIELQRKYDVKFVFKDEEIKKYRFSGVLLDETLEQVLNVIKLTAPIDFYLEGKTVLLIPNKVQINNYSKHLR